MTIRPLRPEDREPILRLLRETEVFSSAELDIACELIDIVTAKHDQHDYIINVYEDNGQVLGYYCMGPTPGTEGTYDMYWIAVKPERHGRGVGGALDRHAEDLARSQGGRLIIAETSSRPAYEKTRHFYLRHGYAEVARIRAYYRPDDDLVVFGKYLS